MENNNQNGFSDKKTDTSNVALFQNNNSNVIIIILVIFLILSLLGVNFLLMLGGFLDNVMQGLKFYILKLLSVLGFYTGAVINTSADIAGDTARGGIDIAEGTVQSIGNLFQNRDNMDGPSLGQQQWNMNLFELNPTPKSYEPENSDNIQNQLNMINNKLNQNNMDSENSYIDSSVEKINALNSKITDFADTINSRGSELQELDNEINERKKTLLNLPTESPSSSDMTWCPVGYENNMGQCISIKPGDKCMYGKMFSSKDDCEKNVKQPAFSGYEYQNRSVNWGVPPSPPPPAALAQKPLQTCPQLPGMCLNQKPMCGGGCSKQLPIQMQPIPSRGQIQGGYPGNAQLQQQQQQQQKLTPLPEFPTQPQFPQQQQDTPAPAQSMNNQSSYANPIPGSFPSNLGSNTPIDYSGMIMNQSPAPVQTPAPMTTNTSTYSPAPGTDISNTNKCGGHHHHPHGHDGNCNVSPDSNMNDALNQLDLSTLDSDINNLNSVVSNLKSITNDSNYAQPIDNGLTSSSGSSFTNNSPGSSFTNNVQEVPLVDTDLTSSEQLMSDMLNGTGNNMKTTEPLLEQDKYLNRSQEQVPMQTQEQVPMQTQEQVPMQAAL